jgi:hypothetical protein
LRSGTRPPEWWWCETEEERLAAATLKFEMDSSYADWIVALDDLSCSTSFTEVRLDDGSADGM